MKRAHSSGVGVPQDGARVVVGGRVERGAEPGRPCGVAGAAAAGPACRLVGRLWTGPKEGAVRVAKTRGWVADGVGDALAAGEAGADEVVGVGGVDQAQEGQREARRLPQAVSSAGGLGVGGVGAQDLAGRGVDPCPWRSKLSPEPPSYGRIVARGLARGPSLMSVAVTRRGRWSALPPAGSEAPGRPSGAAPPAPAPRRKAGRRAGPAGRCLSRSGPILPKEAGPAPPRPVTAGSRRRRGIRTKGGFRGRATLEWLRSRRRHTP